MMEMAKSPFAGKVPEPEAQTLLARLRSFGLPNGDEPVRAAYGVRIAEKGEMRSSPRAPWIPFTSANTIDARQSGFCWDAHTGSSRLRSMVITDAYEQGHGRLVVKLGGLIPVANFKGPDFDKGELQRYLASIVHCPPALLLHETLEWAAVGGNTLRVRDLADPTGATIDLDLGPDCRTIRVHADRPRAVGKRSVMTPWSGICHEPKTWEGVRVPSLIEVSWHMPEGEFTYYRSEITTLTLLRIRKPFVGGIADRL